MIQLITRRIILSAIMSHLSFWFLWWGKDTYKSGWNHFSAQHYIFQLQAWLLSHCCSYLFVVISGLKDTQFWYLHFLIVSVLVVPLNSHCFSLERSWLIFGKLTSLGNDISWFLSQLKLESSFSFPTLLGKPCNKKIKLKMKNKTLKIISTNTTGLPMNFEDQPVDGSLWAQVQWDFHSCRCSLEDKLVCSDPPSGSKVSVVFLQGKKIFETLIRH